MIAQLKEKMGKKVTLTFKNGKTASCVIDDVWSDGLVKYTENDTNMVTNACAVANVQ